MCGWDVSAPTVGVFAGREFPVSLRWCAERPVQVGLRVELGSAVAECWVDRAVLVGAVDDGQAQADGVTAWTGHGLPDGMVAVAVAADAPWWLLTESVVGSFLAATEVDLGALALLGEAA